jgi:hypothetical protein
VLDVGIVQYSTHIPFACAEVPLFTIGGFINGVQYYCSIVHRLGPCGLAKCSRR